MKLTEQDRHNVFQAIAAAEKLGDTKEVERLTMLLPVPPRVALAMRDIWSADELLQEGYNFSEVEERYGKDWLVQQ